VLDADGTVLEANPAALALFGSVAIGASGGTLLGRDSGLESLAGTVFTLENERDYRVDVAALPAGSPACQVILEDVTDELSEGRRATRYAALVVAAEESQRQRVARELHDEPLQLFLHLARRLENLGGSKGVPEHVSVGLDEARQQALEAATRLRNLARNLRPPVLDQLGLVAALRSFLADIEEETHLVTSFRVRGTPERVAPDVELGAFRIVQEAVRNTVRHAKAQQVSVSVIFQANQFALVVADDGEGFVRDEKAELGSGHLGLAGMAERANLLGGAVTVEAAPGRGTVVSAILPAGEAPPACAS
jgi:two-component system sensor histidine kinase DegS